MSRIEREIRIGHDALCAGLASVRLELLSMRAIDSESRYIHSTCSMTLSQSRASVPAVRDAETNDLHQEDLHAIRI